MTPSEKLIDSVVTPNEKPEGLKDGELWATHSGELDLGGVKLVCHILSDGKRVFDAESVEKFFIGISNELK